MEHLTTKKDLPMKYIITLLTLLLITPFACFSQVEDVKTEKKAKEKLQKSAFEGLKLIDNQTNVVHDKKTLEAVMEHRFGLINGGTNDLKGFWAPTNIRIGLNYGLTDRITIGFGTTKDNRFQDFNLKVALLNQTVSNKMPVSVTYYGNFAIDARSRDNFQHLQHRYSYFNQIIIARRITDMFSVQIAPSVSHFNLVEEGMKNDMIAIAFGARAKISPQTSISFDYSQPLTKFEDSLKPKAGISIGAEFSTGTHVFQIFVSNTKGIVPQKNYFYNQNDFLKGDILIGFTITRSWFF